MDIGLAAVEIVDDEQLEIVRLREVVRAVDAVFRNVEQIVRMEVVADLRAVLFLEQLAALAVQNQDDLVAVVVRVGACCAKRLTYY